MSQVPALTVLGALQRRHSTGACPPALVGSKGSVQHTEAAAVVLAAARRGSEPGHAVGSMPSTAPGTPEATAASRPGVVALEAAAASPAEPSPPAAATAAEVAAGAAAAAQQQGGSVGQQMPAPAWSQAKNWNRVFEDVADPQAPNRLHHKLMSPNRWVLCVFDLRFDWEGDQQRVCSLQQPF